MNSCDKPVDIHIESVYSDNVGSKKERKMGTHAMIGIWNSNTGVVTASYVHYDGYVEGVGRTLVENYNDYINAEFVATGGYLSSLESDHSKSKREAVHEDPAVQYSSVEEYLNEGYDYASAHYLYLWDGDAWFFTATGDNTKFEEVAMNLSTVGA
jgi:hypothetical protein